MQGRGFGRASMAHILSSLRRIPHCRRVRLLVAPDNLYARRLYEQASFRPVAMSGSGELVLEAKLSGTAIREVRLVVMIRLVATPGHRCHVGRLRSSVGPYAAPTIGVERGPPPLSIRGLVCTVVDPPHPLLFPLGLIAPRCAFPAPHHVAARFACGFGRDPGITDKEVVKCLWQFGHSRSFDRPILELSIEHYRRPMQHLSYDSYRCE